MLTSFNPPDTYQLTLEEGGHLVVDGNEVIVSSEPGTVWTIIPSGLAGGYL